MPLERELKFRLPARHAATELWRLFDAKPRRRHLVATYLDTDKGALRAAHAALRLRRSGRRWLQCFKAEPSPGAVLLGRPEWELVARGGRLGVRAFPLDEIRARTGVDLADLEPRLGPVFTTEFDRSMVEENLPGARIEVALDRGAIAVDGRREPLREVEFELLEGDFLALLGRARSLIPVLDLELEVRSKAERGYRLAQGRRAQPVKARQPNVDPQGDVRTAIAPVVAVCIAQVAANAAGAAASRDPEYLHQLRVGLRRLRSALRALRDFAPADATQALVGSLRATLPPLGVARDWDVVTELLERRIVPAAAGGLDFAAALRWVKRRRGSARRQARDVAASSAFQLLMIDAMTWAETSRRTPDPAAAVLEPAPAAASFAKRAVARLIRKVEQAAAEGDWTNAEARHRVRIRLKRLRYVCEFFADCFKRKRVRRYLEHLEGLQDLLGELNDLATARRLFADLNESGQSVQRAFVYGWISAREDALILALSGAWRALAKQARPA
jgi:triphosphatase